MKVKLFMDDWEEFIFELSQKLFAKIPNNADDDVFEFNIEINNIKDITDKVGLDDRGFRAFRGVNFDEEVN